MALQTEGPISLWDIQQEFGGSAPTRLEEYYKGRTYVLTTDYAPNVPISLDNGPISVTDFYGAKRTTLTTVTFDVAGDNFIVLPETFSGVLYLVSMTGAGGGGGGPGSFQGYVGYSGQTITGGSISAAAGDLVNAFVGMGGGPGDYGGGSAGGGESGSDYRGGLGGSFGGQLYQSGGGGGGGQASVVFVNTIPQAVAGGGGGGGGGAGESGGLSNGNNPGTAGTTYGAYGQGKAPGQGAGAGGGGGGATNTFVVPYTPAPGGGAGGLASDYENWGAYSGENGNCLLPSLGSVVSTGSNGGALNSDGGSGTITLSYYS